MHFIDNVITKGNKMTTTTLKTARAKVNALEFGTAEWEAAMQVVRNLVEQENAATDFGRHTSVDGDVWSV